MSSMQAWPSVRLFQISVCFCETVYCDCFALCSILLRSIVVCGEEVYRGTMWSRDVLFSVSSLPTDSLFGWVIPLQQGFNLEWPKQQ